jgi:uncharacterized protein
MRNQLLIGFFVFGRKISEKRAAHWGFIFGLGWAITGACPGPLFAQIGSGFTVILITLLSAVAGTWVYGRFRGVFSD